MSAAPTPIRIFVSSPGDVRDERGACLRAIALLNQRYKDQLALEGIVWEEQFYPAHTDFQTWINQQTPPWACDLVVCILWSRIGTPLSDAWPTRRDGTRYESGTVAEFEMSRDRALQLHTPDLYMFLKRAPLPGADSADALARTADAKRVVEHFIQRWFHQGDAVDAPGAGPVHPFTAGINPFVTTEEFEDRIVVFLENWLRENGRIDAPRTWDIHDQGLPYVGLAPFDQTHAAVFFGRDAERKRARRLLSDADAAGLPYLLIAGGSGVGKSSLARAGLLADLCVDTPQDVWAHAILLADPEPIPALARALLSDSCALRPHLAAAHFGVPDKLAAALAVPDVAVTILTGALDSLAHSLATDRAWTTTPTARLLLVIDQTEALADAPQTAQRALVVLVAALAASKKIWIVATIRADRQAALLAQAPLPEIAPLLTGLLDPDLPQGAELKLTPPDEAAMREIIEAPARAAGLCFEEDPAGRSLADDLRTAMAGHPDALPLMQKLLQRIFADSREASWAAYDRLGRLDGAIADTADAAIAPLSDPARAELRPLLLALTADIAPDGAATSRPTSRALFATTPERASLVAALLDARLLATDEQDRLRVAHEAVLRTWPRARELLAGAAAFIRLRERLRFPWQEWHAGGAVLPPGPLLSEAALALPALQSEPDTAPLAALVEFSIAADRRARRQRTAIWTAATLVLALLAGVSLFFASEARRAASESDRQRHFADTARAQAVENEALARQRQEDAETQKRLAESERARAEQNAAEADRQKTAATAAAAQSERTLVAALSAVSTLVFDLAQGLRDRAGMPTDMIRAILAMSDRVLDGLDKAAPGDDRVKRLRAASLSEASQTLLTNGAVGDARIAAEMAAALTEELAAGHPDDAQAERDLSVSREKLGDVMLAQGNGPGVLREYRASLAIRERLISRDEANALWQHDVSGSHGKIGDALVVQGDGAAALSEYRAGLAIVERLAAKDRDSVDLQHDLSVAHSKVGDALLMQSDAVAALSEFRTSLAIIERIVATDSSNAEWQRMVSNSNLEIGQALMAVGDNDGALTHFRASLAVQERLASQDGGNTTLQSDLSVSRDWIGDGLLAQGDTTGALGEYRESLVIRERLTSRDGGNVFWQRNLLISHQKIGELLMAQHHLDEALREYRASLAISERLASHDDSNRQWRRDLVFCHYKIAVINESMHAFVPAMEQFRTAIEMSRALVGSDGTNATWQSELQTLRETLGNLSYQLLLDRHPAEALTAAEAALPGDPPRLWIATNRAHALMLLGRTDEARALYLAHRGQDTNDDTHTPWEDAIRNDFAALRKAGIDAPLMDEILADFAHPPTP